MREFFVLELPLAPTKEKPQPGTFRFLMHQIVGFLEVDGKMFIRTTDGELHAVVTTWEDIKRRGGAYALIKV